MTRETEELWLGYTVLVMLVVFACWVGLCIMGAGR